MDGARGPESGGTGRGGGHRRLPVPDRRAGGDGRTRRGSWGAVLPLPPALGPAGRAAGTCRRPDTRGAWPGPSRGPGPAAPRTCQPPSCSPNTRSEILLRHYHVIRAPPESTPDIRTLPGRLQRQPLPGTQTLGGLAKILHQPRPRTTTTGGTAMTPCHV